MHSKQISHLLLLSAVPGIGHNRIRTLVSKFGSPQKVLRATYHQLIATELIDATMAKRVLAIQSTQKEFARSQFELIRKHGVKIVTLWDKEYPKNLSRLYDPPAFLYTLGKIRDEDETALAIVGTRSPTHYGIAITETLTRELVSNGFTIVSGLARGIDSAAHRTALRHGGRTLAVLGSGLDNIYPTENIRLARDITKHGAVISDYPMQTNPDAVNFPGRNRLISGLSFGTIVVEAGNRSGALITAFYANDQNREVFAVPGPVTAKQSRGTHKLIKNGAKLVETVDDVLEELQGVMQKRVQNVPAPRPDLRGREKIIYQTLGAEPIHVDQIAGRNAISVQDTLYTLLTLELLGCVKQLPGKHFIRI